MCVWVLMAVTSLCRAHKWTIAGVSIETCLERYDCVRNSSFCFSPTSPFLSVNFQIFILHYILSPYMKRAFKPRAKRSKLFFSFHCLHRMCGMDLQMMCAQCRRNRYSSCKQSTKRKSYLLYFDRLHSPSHHEIAVYFRIFCVWLNGVSLFFLRVDDRRLNVCWNNESKTNKTRWRWLWRKFWQLENGFKDAW